MKKDRSTASLSKRHIAALQGAWLVVPFAAALCAPAAYAQEDDLPLFLTVSQSFTRDSNLLRTSDNEEADTVSTSAARFGLNKAYGRQNYQLDVTASHNKYSNFDEFNNNSLTGSGEFVTEVGANFRLTANANASQTLPKFEDNNTNRTGRNTLTTNRASVDLRYGLHGKLSVNGGYVRSKVKYRLTDYENRDSDTWQLGLRYQPHNLMYYGLTYAHTDSDLPNLSVGEEHVQRRNLSLVANWQVTGFSLFSGSLGYSQERYDLEPIRDFNGVTGTAAWTFTPAGKVSYRVNWRRDTNNEGGSSYSYQLFTSIVDVNSSVNRVTNQYSASATWQATAKISSTLQFVHVRYDEERKEVSSLNALGVSTTESDNQVGRLNIVSLGVNYQAMRNLSMGCDVQRYDRTESIFSRAYAGESVSCNVGYTLD